MVLWGVGEVQVSKKGHIASADSVGQERLPSTRAYLVIGDKFWPIDIQNPPKVPDVQRVDLLWAAAGVMIYLETDNRTIENSNCYRYLMPFGLKMV